MNFGKQLVDVMARHGDRPAMISSHEQLTYAQAVDRSKILASNLAAAGVRTGDRIGIAMQDNLEVVLAILACWHLDATAAVLDFRTPRAQRARTARDFAFALVLESHSPPGNEGYPSLQFEREWLFSGSSAAKGLGPAHGSYPAFLMFSSGTTGDPKAYIQTHETLSQRVSGRRLTRDGSTPRFLSAMTFAHVATRHYVFGHLLAGGVVRFFPPLFTPSELIEGLLSFGATGTGQPPPVIARMAQEVGERQEVMFPGLHLLDSMGGPARPEDKIAAYRNLSRGYRIGYSSSLTGRISRLAGADVLAKPESAGRLFDGVKVDILGEDGQPLPLGERGVIRVWTPMIASSVLLPGDKPYVDPKVMGPDWGIPGDIGFLDEDGFLTVVDRQEDMIVRGGVNVAPQELEKLIQSHPNVADVAVAGFPDDLMGQEIAAFIVAKDGLTVDELRGFLNLNIVSDKRPRVLRLVETLPRNFHGKLLRRQLVEELMRERKKSDS